MPKTHPWKSTGSKRTISWKYEPSELVMQYLYDMRDAVRNGVLLAEEMRRRNGNIPTPINLRKELKPWFDSQFDYAKHHINPVCQASVSALKSNRKRKILTKSPQINKLSIRLDAMLVKIFPDKLRITIKPGVYEWILLNTQNKKWKEFAQKRIAEVLITKSIVAIAFKVQGKKAISEEKIGVDLNFKNITATIVKPLSLTQVIPDIDVQVINTTSVMKLQNNFARRTRKLQKKVTNEGKRNRMLERASERRNHQLNDVLHKISTNMVRNHPFATFVFEDLTGVRKRGAGRNKKFKEMLNNWPYYKLQSMVKYKSSFQTIFVDPRGTSSECPVCGEKLKHPEWKISKCNNCDRNYERDRLASLAIALRGIDLCGDPFPVSALASLPIMTSEYLYTGNLPEDSRVGLTETAYATNNNIN